MNLVISIFSRRYNSGAAFAAGHQQFVASFPVVSEVWTSESMGFRKPGNQKPGNLGNLFCYIAQVSFHRFPTFP